MEDVLEVGDGPRSADSGWSLETPALGEKVTLPPVGGDRAPLITSSRLAVSIWDRLRSTMARATDTDEEEHAATSLEPEV